jgi:hypothetical protein
MLRVSFQHSGAVSNSGDFFLKKRSGSSMYVVYLEVVFYLSPAGRRYLAPLSNRESLPWRSTDIAAPVDPQPWHPPLHLHLYAIIVHGGHPQSSCLAIS